MYGFHEGLCHSLQQFSIKHTVPDINIMHLSTYPVFWECCQPKGSTGSVGRAQHTAHVWETLQRRTAAAALCPGSQSRSCAGTEADHAGLPRPLLLISLSKVPTAVKVWSNFHKRNTWLLKVLQLANVFIKINPWLPQCGSGSCNTRPNPAFSRLVLPQGALTDWELSLLLSLDLFFASLFFFLCRGLDSRIISSSSKVGSQCRRPFCQDTRHDSRQAQQRLRNHRPLRTPLLSQWFLQPEEQPCSGWGHGSLLLTLGTKPGSTRFSHTSLQTTPDR